jgi:hypothetical protein
MNTFPDNGEQRQTPEELFHGGESGSIPLGSAINFNGLASQSAQISKHVQ